MNHFKCPCNPFTCEHSLFLEDTTSSDGIKKRWVECVEYQFVEDPVSKKPRRVEAEEFKLVVDGAETIVRKGDLCVNSPADWWKTYKNLLGEDAAHWGGSPLRAPSPDNLICIGHNCNKIFSKKVLDK